MKHSIEKIVLVALFSMQPLQADFFSKDFFKQWAPAIIVGAAAGFGGYFWGYKKGAAKHSYNADLGNTQTDVVSARVPEIFVRNQQGIDLAREVEKQALLEPLQEAILRLKSESAGLQARVSAQESSEKSLQDLNTTRAQAHARKVQLSELAEIIPMQPLQEAILRLKSESAGLQASVSAQESSEKSLQDLNATRAQRAQPVEHILPAVYSVVQSSTPKNNYNQNQEAQKQPPFRYYPKAKPFWDIGSKK